MKGGEGEKCQRRAPRRGFIRESGGLNKKRRVKNENKRHSPGPLQARVYIDRVRWYFAW